MYKWLCIIDEYCPILTSTSREKLDLFFQTPCNDRKYDTYVIQIEAFKGNTRLLVLQ